MKNKLIFLFWASIQLACIGCAQNIGHEYIAPSGQLGPAKLYGELFHQVQMSGIYSDSKTFVDSTPRHSAAVIMGEYHESKDEPGFDLESFVEDNFILPPNIASGFKSDSSRSAEEHINILWDILTRTPNEPSDGTLIPLPYPYIVPGGRFREVYYWDSYFTMLGLQESERWDLIESMVDNFSYLIGTMGFIPNGNRTYYQGRSQPPFYSLMVKLLEEGSGKGTLTKYRPQLLKEYDFWMDGAEHLSADSPSYRRVVRLADGSIMNRYWDDLPAPRPESYQEDVELVEEMDEHGDLNESKYYRHIRAAAESGWDFSSRWFKDGYNMSSIHTTEIIPVDLNSLLYHLELVLAEAFEETGESATAAEYRQLARDRKEALLRCCWSEADGFFRDYDFVSGTQTKALSLAAVYPLFFNMVSQQKASKIAQLIGSDFLQAGGVTTTLKETGQQWDAPNGWAPLQWITIEGLRNYGHQALADTIESRWVKLNIDVYNRTGKMVEKYNVYNTGLEGGGGEYPVQDGFGWTNGVLLKLLEN
jgi:alpha,alpha-trehalase